jgi:hypothetical protein
MSQRIQFSVRLEPELNEKFQVKLQSMDWNKNRVISRLIESFVEGEVAMLLPSETGTEKLLQEVQEMKRQIAALQALLSLALSQRLPSNHSLSLLGGQPTDRQSHS